MQVNKGRFLLTASNSSTLCRLSTLPAAGNKGLFSALPAGSGSQRVCWFQQQMVASVLCDVPEIITAFSCRDVWSGVKALPELWHWIPLRMIHLQVELTLFFQTTEITTAIRIFAVIHLMSRVLLLSPPKSLQPDWKLNVDYGAGFFFCQWWWLWLYFS